MGTLIYDAPHHRAAVLLHCLARVPALEHSNELFAAQVAYAYLHASGIEVKFSSPRTTGWPRRWPAWCGRQGMLPAPAVAEVLARGGAAHVDL